MKSDLINQHLESSITRRRIVGTGAKLAYTAPLVAASFNLNAAAAQTVSAGCIAGTCEEPNICGDRCGCREADGATLCLQQMRCSEVQTCASSATCPDGYVCLTPSCCRDGVARCVPACFDTSTGSQANGFLAADFMVDDGEGLVLGPGV